MANEWRTVTISDISSQIAMGPFGSNIKKSTYTKDGVPIINGAHLKGIKVDLTNGCNFISEEHADKLEKCLVKKDDIVITHRGTIGQVSIIPEIKNHERLIISQSQMYLRCNETLVNPQYVNYWFKTPEGQHKLLANASSVGVPAIAQASSYLKTIQLSIPSREYQDAVVKVLSAFDDKIEVNNKISNILWSLISFSYQTIIRDPSCSQGKLSDISQFVNEKADCTEASVDSYIGTENIFPNKAGYTFAKSVPNTGKVTKFSSGDTLVSNIRPYFKKIVFAETAGYCSNDVLCFRPKTTENSKFLYSILYQDSFFDYMTLGSKGTKMPRGDKGHIMNFNIFIPNDESLLKFNAFTAPIFSLISNIRSQNKLLTQLRELILPKLLSGEIGLKNQ